MTDLIGNTENAYEQESMLYILLNSSFFLADPSKLQKASVFLLNFIKNVLVAFMELDYLEQCKKVDSLLVLFGRFIMV